MFVIYDYFKYFMTNILPKATNYEIDLKDHRNNCDWKKCEAMGRETKRITGYQKELLDISCVKLQLCSRKVVSLTCKEHDRS